MYLCARVLEVYIVKAVMITKEFSLFSKLESKG